MQMAITMANCFIPPACSVISTSYEWVLKMSIFAVDLMIVSTVFEFHLSEMFCSPNFVLLTSRPIL